MGKVPFRQVHLDFHTSEAIENIGTNFSKKQFQKMLKMGYVNSITVFSKCHHGWSYHPTKVGEIHPHLKYDLLGSMIEAAHEIGVKTPVYLSGGYDERVAREHSDWLWRDREGKTWVPDFMQPGYHFTCMNTPYLQLLLSQLEEVLRNYDADGIFIDIVKPRECYCQYCMSDLRRRGEDPRNTSAVIRLGEEVYAHYTDEVKRLVESIRPGLGIFHNNGHIKRGRRDLTFKNTHLELESLPTGGWGYDHFPLSVSYARNLGLEYMGMTGKFHGSWGEFGGYKHPNALRYETSLSLANGARCSVGDQLHPEGLMDEATYRLIGAAYCEVEKKEEWCSDMEQVADIGVLSVEAVYLNENYGKRNPPKPDVGATRMLLEGKFLFDIIDLEEDFNIYKVIILPDVILITPLLKAKLDIFLERGGKILATGKSGLNEAGSAFALDMGVRWVETNAYKPDYFRPHFEIPGLGKASFIQYSQGQRIELDGGIELGVREDPYFNRDLMHFCSHHHTPVSSKSGGPGMVESKNGIYIAWNIFEDYAKNGSFVSREIITEALNRILKDKTLETSLAAQGIVTLMHQPPNNRYIAHLLYVVPVKRGEGIEIIEDIQPVYDIDVVLRLTHQAKRVYLAPQGTEIPYVLEKNELHFKVEKLDCHQMIVIDYC